MLSLGMLTLLLLSFASLCRRRERLVVLGRDESLLALASFSG